MPALAGEHQGALTVVHLLSLQGGHFKQLGLDGATMVVHVFELFGQAHGGIYVVGHKHVEGPHRIPHAACSVQSGNDGEAQIIGGHGLIGSAGHIEQGLNARARSLIHAGNALRYQRAVLLPHGHEVGHSAQGGEVGVFPPQMGLAKATAQGLHHLQGNAHTSQNAAGTLGVYLRVYQRHAHRHRVAGLMMVGDEDLYAPAQQLIGLLAAGDAAVDGDDTLGVIGLAHAIDGGNAQAVAFV